MTTPEKNLATLAYGKDDIQVSHGCYDSEEHDCDPVYCPPVVTGPGGDYLEDATDDGVGFWPVLFVVISVVAFVAGAVVVML